MDAAPGFARLLLGELAAAGLVPPHDRYHAARSEITRRGVAERGRLVEVVGARTWRRALATLGRGAPDEDCARVLGFGSMLAEFAVAPLALPDETRRAVAHLGALANLVGSLYDGWVDLGCPADGVLPRSVLARAARGAGGGARDRVLLPLMPPRRAMMTRLVAEYFRRLRELPPARRDLVARVVLRMYDAESATAGAPSSAVPDRLVRRKSVLPVVVLGLAGWPAAPALSASRARWHARWLCQVGEFVGWVDDAVDLADDLDAGRVNRLARAVTAARDEQALVDLARRVAAQGSRVLAEWRRETAAASPSSPAPEALADALGACVTSWFGGTAVVFDRARIG